MSGAHMKRLQALSDRRAQAPHWVYHCFDSSGRLVYVGCTVRLFQRLGVHQRRSWWADQVVKVKANVVHGKAAGLRAEKHAIGHESPRWNISGRWAWRRRWGQDDFRDFVYSNLRAGLATLESERIVRVYAEYQNRFGVSLEDPRIDAKDWSVGRVHHPVKTGQTA